MPSLIRVDNRNSSRITPFSFLFPCIHKKIFFVHVFNTISEFKLKHHHHHQKKYLVSFFFFFFFFFFYLWSADDHNRVQLASDDNSDYINASTIFDSDPKCKYIATQGPMSNTTNAFWQMVWEQGSCVIVALTRPIENGITMCHHYWPVEGSIQYDDFEVNLVSEHIYSDDYVVRNFYFANIQTMETRTITQFHFLTWDELCNPPSTKAILDFRRKVNKCCRGTSAPLIVHCNDGVGRTGTYLVLDIVLNCIQRGAREINIPATLEHIRGQRDKMIKTKEQFEFVFSAVAEEATDLLKALSQKD